MEEIDLAELFQMFFKKKLLIILVVIVFALSGAVYTLNFITPIYKSTTSLVLIQTATEAATTSITTTDITLNSKLVDNYREIAKSRSVIGTVINNLGLDDTIEEIQKSITVTSISDTEVINITVANVDKEKACSIAKEIAEVFMAKIEETYKVKNISVLDQPEVAEKPYNINMVKNIAIFSFIGLCLVSGYILLINTLDTTIKSDSDIEKHTGLPVLATIMESTEDQRTKIGGTKVRRPSQNRAPRSSSHDFEPHSEVRENTNINNKESNTNEDTESLFSYVNGDTKTNNNVVKRRKKGGAR